MLIAQTVAVAAGATAGVQAAVSANEKVSLVLVE